jgi:hypothetical protein
VQARATESAREKVKRAERVTSGWRVRVTIGGGRPL